MVRLKHRKKELSFSNVQVNRIVMLETEKSKKPSHSLQSLTDVYISVVIPIYNEEPCLETLYQRLIPVLETLGKPWELILTNDGSQDASSKILREFHHRKPKNIRIIEFSKNFGQHMAIMAAFEKARGEVIVNLDADLQNPPEEIPRLLAKFEEGYDLVSGYRQNRHDSFYRKFVSKLSNVVRESMTGIKIKDHGCMLKAYSRDIVKKIVNCKESSTFITVLAYTFATNPTDIPVKHEVREEGVSKYTPLKLIEYSLDMFTSSSTIPLRLFTLFGFFVSGLSAFLVFYLVMRRLFIGPEAEGVFTLFAIAFFLISVAITGIGVVGEYVGRIYQVVRERPRFSIKEILENINESN